MKRTFERIGFMLIGAMLVCTAYLIGNLDHHANADETADEVTFENVRIKGDLFVGGAIAVGKTGADVFDFIIIEANDENSYISLGYRHRKSTASSDAHILISAGKDSKNIPSAVIRLSDKLNNTALGSSRVGWKKLQR